MKSASSKNYSLALSFRAKPDHPLAEDLVESRNLLCRIFPQNNQKQIPRLRLVILKRMTKLCLE